jgi:hypothetical protein
MNKNGMRESGIDTSKVGKAINEYEEFVMLYSKRIEFE